MTKQEAMLKIKHVRENVSGYENSQHEISQIIDQIDQPAGEFTVRELCELISATHVNHPGMSVELFGDGSWICSAFDNECIDTLRAKLIELAKPPEPKTIIVELDTCDAKRWAEFIGPVGKACKVALEKAGVK